MWDAVLGKPAEACEATVSLHVSATGREQVIELQTGFFRDTSASFELTDDGRLKSTAAESTGQLGKVVLGVVGAGATVAGVLAGGPVGAVGSARLLRVDGRESASVEIPVAGFNLAQAVEDAYRDANPAVADLRDCYGRLVEKTLKEIAEGAARLTDPDGNANRWKEVVRLRQIESLLPILRTELDRLNAHFKAWRASSITSHVETHQRCFSLDTLRGAGVELGSSGNVTFAAQADPAVKSAWQDLGVAVTVEPLGKVQTLPTTEPNEVLVRFPRRVRLAVYEKVGEKALLREVRPQLVVDAACQTEVVKLRRSLWAKRSVALGFSDLGVLTSYKQTSNSSAVAAVTALGGIPASATGGLAQAASIQTKLAAIGSAGLNAEADRVKKQVELEQQELALAGLKASDKDRARLEQLTRAAEILEKLR